MSIFPKRTVAGGGVTIHWNLTLPANMEKPVCPYVRIGIKDPAGNLYMLFEEHVLLLPSTTAAASTGLQQPSPYHYLKKHTPLLVLASYLSGNQSREKLAELLTNIQNGRHYYFTWPVPHNAVPGKYTLLSEMHIDGSCKFSGTVSEDYFFIDQLDIQVAAGEAIIRNAGPEPVPVKLISYVYGDHHRPENIDIIYLEGNTSHTVITAGKAFFLVYNEERITIPLHTTQKRPLRNQLYFTLSKEEAGEPVKYILPREGEHAFRLSGAQLTIWNAADGIHTTETLRKINSAGFDELFTNGIITEQP